MSTAAEEYKICQRRGHQPTDHGWSNNTGSYQVCKWCETSYRIETTHRVVEVGAPAEPGVEHD